MRRKPPPIRPDRYVLAALSALLGFGLALLGRGLAALARKDGTHVD